MTNPVVSLVIPVYNSEKTVGKCLDSLINQTYRNIEIICVNDCSKDNSLKVLQSYAEKDDRIVIINHTENKNAGGARNSGIHAAQGEYICFVDNDDWMREDAFELLIKESDNGMADIVASDWVTYYSEDNQIFNKNLPDDLSHDNIIKYVCMNGFRMIGSLYKKSLFFDNNLFYPEKLFFEDNAIGLPLICMAKCIKYIKQPLYYYACAPNSVTSSVTGKKVRDRIKTTCILKDNLGHMDLTPEYIEWTNGYCLKICFATICMLAHLSSCNTVEDWKMLSAIIHECNLPTKNNKLSIFGQIVVRNAKLCCRSLRLVHKLKLIKLLKTVFRILKINY